MAYKSIEASLKLLVEKAVKSFKEECNKKIEDLNTELLKVKRSQDFISTQYDKLNDEYFKLIETNKKQEAEIKKLKAESNVMSAQGPKEQWCRSLFSIGGIICNFTPILPYFQHWGAWTSTTILFRCGNLVKTKRKMQIEHFFSPISGEDQKKRSSARIEHFGA